MPAKTFTPKRAGRKQSLFPERLRLLMQSRQFTKQQLAEAAGVTTATVRAWLRGTEPQSSETLFHLCKIFGTSFEWLFPGVQYKRIGLVLSCSLASRLQNLARKYNRRPEELILQSIQGRFCRFNKEGDYAD